MKSLADCLERIAECPADLSLRLDLADFLQRQKKPELARWMRQELAVANAFAPIGCTYPTLSVWGSIRYSSYIRIADAPSPRIEKWKAACPTYWTTTQHCRIGEYFGRWVISCWATNSPSNREAVDELGGMTWLQDLYRDGLLEIVEYNFGKAETVDWALEWPEAIRNLPFFLNAARASGDGYSRDLSRRLFLWPSLIGLYLTQGTFPTDVLAQLPELTPGIQFMSLELERRTKMVDEIVRRLPEFRDLRLLSLHGPIKFSEDDLAALLGASSLSAFGTDSPHLTRSHLFTLGQSPSLKWLGINSDTLTRTDLAEFRAEFPNVQLLLSEVMQARIGPA